MSTDLKDNSNTRKGEKPGLIKTQTVIIIAFIVYAIGFISGVAFTVYKQYTLAVNDQKIEPRQAAAENDQHGQDFQEMERMLEKEAEKSPNSAEVWTQLGNLYFDHNEFQMAIQAYSKSIELEPDNPDVLTDLGVMYRRNKQPEKAIEAFNRAMGADPKHIVSQFNKGIVLLHDLDDIEAAIAVWENLLKTNPLAKAPNGKTVEEMVNYYKNQLKKK